jgi:uncharacterized protein YjbJ (UPF0337 family)
MGLSNQSTRAEGKGEENRRKIKAGVGKLIGNEQMAAEGKAQNKAGRSQERRTHQR